MHATSSTISNTESSSKSTIDWTNVIEQWKNSKLSQIAFCKLNQIDYNQFVYQKSKLRVNTKPKPGFLPVNLLSNSAASPSTANNFMLFCPNGVKVSIPTNIHPDSLKALITCLGIR